MSQTEKSSVLSAGISVPLREDGPSSCPSTCVSRLLWVIISPIFAPAPGGAAIYTKLLARRLAESGVDVLVATEAYPGEPDVVEEEIGSGWCRIERLFPFRAGRASKTARSFFDYAVQNFLFFEIPRRVRAIVRARGTQRIVFLIHFSFFYNPTLLGALLPGLRAIGPGGVRLIADVRDPLFTDSHAKHLKRFDGVIGCSRQVVDRLKKLVGEQMVVAHIPIPFELPDPPAESVVKAASVRYSLNQGRFLFNPNGIKDDKGYPLLLETTRLLRSRPGYADVVLATAGRKRDWAARDDDAEREGVLRYLGVIPQEDVLALAKAAMLTAIVGENEGLPRAAIECLAVGGNIIVPSIPEFLETMPAHIAVSGGPELLSRQIIDLTEHLGRPNYPIHLHDIKRLVAEYRALEPVT